jgi:transmembrane 9 superfamily protein 2/4
MIVISTIFAAIGFVSPDNRGSIVTIMILVFVFMGGFAGYTSARFYRMFHGKQWLINALYTALLYPSVAFSVFFIINILLWFEGSAGAVPFTTLLSLLVLWICCSAPLVLIGSFIGLKTKAIKNPGTINVVPTTIPQQPWYLSAKVMFVASGLFPFA